MTAEEFYKKYGGFSQYNSPYVGVSIFMPKNFKLDSKGYVIEFNNFLDFMS